MSDIKLVIKIDEEIYKNIIENGFIYDEDNEYVTHSIENSIPLPKGHGRLRLIEEDKLEKHKEPMTGINGDSDYAIRMYHIRNLSTIIEEEKYFRF